MYKIYLCAFIVSLSLLIISVFISGISDLFHSLSALDFHSGDFGSDALSSFLPFSPLEICGFCIGFGGIGLLTYQISNYHLLFAIIAGFIISLPVKWLLRALKQVDNSTISDIDLIGREGTVITKIFQDSVGSISLNTKTGKITYSAKSNKDLPQGTHIKVIDVVNHTLIVSDDMNAPLLTKDSTSKINQ